MAHIIILGAGIGGMPAAYELRALLDKTHRITVVNAVDYFQFVPSNPWRAVGWRERESITFPIRPYLEKKGIKFVAQLVQRIDAKGNALELADGTALTYDYLVMTTGPKLAFDEVPGAGPHASRSRSAPPMMPIKPGRNTSSSYKILAPPSLVHCLEPRVLALRMSSLLSSAPI